MLKHKGKGALCHQYIYECLKMNILASTETQDLPAGDYYPLQDLLYRTKALTDDQGDIVEAYDYDAYGNTLIFSAAGVGGDWWADDSTQANYGACEVLYDGYRYDTESKLYQVRNREYYPTLGRWLQRDPIGFDGGDWNLYGYVNDKPVSQTDELGLYSKGECFYAWSHFYEQRWADKTEVCQLAKRKCNSHVVCPDQPDPTEPIFKPERFRSDRIDGRYRDSCSNKSGIWLALCIKAVDCVCNWSPDSCCKTDFSYCTKDCDEDFGNGPPFKLDACHLKCLQSNTYCEALARK